MAKGTPIGRRLLDDKGFAVKEAAGATVSRLMEDNENAEPMIRAFRRAGADYLWKALRGPISLSEGIETLEAGARALRHEFGPANSDKFFAIIRPSLPILLVETFTPCFGRPARFTLTLRGFELAKESYLETLCGATTTCRHVRHIAFKGNQNER
ncbi:hypothetical protein KM043_001695 [Ampulex compressa]|nr:hypothetical protein KM043_001695 [Ampulex compressa]